jgi:isopenicillin N synthase-like dioxygenase
MRTTTLRRSEQLLTKGWLRLSTPTLPPTLLHKCYGDWERFFSTAEKELFSAAPGALDGYFPMNSEKALGSESPDPKEFFHWYRAGKGPELCAQSTAEVFTRLEEVAHSLFAELAETMPELRPFVSDIRKSQRLVLRIAHYLGKGEPYLNAPHEDIDFLTILPAATDPGLEVLENDRWIDAAARTGECIALTGDMLTEATGGKIKPLRHRVIPAVSERLSMSFFMNPDDHVQLSPIWNAGALLQHRLRDIGLEI